MIDEQDGKDYTLYNGDCLEIMKKIPSHSVDLVLCDLPYGTTGNKWDTVIPFDKLWEQYKRLSKSHTNVVLFSSHPFTVSLVNSNIAHYRYEIIWVKNVPTGMASAKYRPMKYHENILVFSENKALYNPIMKPRVGIGKACYNYDHYCNPNNHIKLDKVKRKYDPDWVQPSTVLNFNVVPNRKGKLHSTQKPVDLCEYLIATYSNINMTVLDNCMGSGTTGV